MLYADRVVRVTGLLILRVTWEPEERFHCGTVFSLTTVLLILIHTGNGGVHFVRNQPFY